MYLELKNNFQIEVKDTSTATSIQAELQSVDEVNTVTQNLEVEDNLSEFKFTDGGENVYGIYKDHKYVNTTYSKNEETGKIEAIFSIRPLSELELRMASLEQSQKDQDNAIVELAETMGGNE